MKKQKPYTYQPQKLGNDLISGASNIAEELNEPLRRIYHLLATKQLPGFKIAGRWYVRRSTLLAFFNEAELEAHHDR